MARGAEALTIVPPDASQLDADLFHLRLLATTGAVLAGVCIPVPCLTG